MLEGLKETGFDHEHDHTLEDDSDASFAIDCAQGLRFLSQVVGDQMLDMTYQFVCKLL